MRLYLDTNVFGFAAVTSKPQWHIPSVDVVAAIQQGQHELVLSDVVEDELIPKAPVVVHALYWSLRQDAEWRVTTSDVETLARAYVTARKWPGALHIAHATLAACNVLLSWDGQHLVKNVRISEYNQVNTTRGLAPIEIMRPDEFLRRYL